MQITKLMLVDDSDVVINGLRGILKPYEDFEVVGEASDGCEAIVKARALLPDLILMDAQMPIMDGIESTLRIKELMPNVKILVLAVHESHGQAAFGAGADSVLMKDSGRSELVREIRRLVKPSQYLITN